MRSLAVLVVLGLVSNPCLTKSLPEESSVVSIYTTLPTTSGTSSGLDVYQQIANNLAERISTPFYRLFGVNNNKTITKSNTTTKPPKPWQNLELFGEEDQSNPTQEDNEIMTEKDTEELSVEALNRMADVYSKKPEKITIFNSYLPRSEDLVKNETENKIDDFDELQLEQVEQPERRSSFYLFLEYIGSIIQLAWGFISALSSPSSASGASS